MKSFEFTAIKILEKYQFSREDAEAFLETIKEAKSEDNATKAGIKKTDENILRLEREIQEIKRGNQEIKKDALETKKDIRTLDVKIESSKNQVIIWVVSFNLAAIGEITAIMKYL